MQLRKYARKRIHNCCLVQIESPVTHDNCSVSLGKTSWQNFNSQLAAIKKSYNKENMKCLNICYTWIWDMFCPYLCYIHVRKCNMTEPMLHTQKKKNDIQVRLHFFFYICKCIMSFSILVFFFSEFGQMHIKMFQKLRGSDSLVFKDLGIASTDNRWHSAISSSRQQQCLCIILSE